MVLKQCWEWLSRCMKNHLKRCTKNHVIFRHLYRFLPEESDRLNFHAGVNQVTLSLTHGNGYWDSWLVDIIHIADPNNGFSARHTDRWEALLTLCLCYVMKQVRHCWNRGIMAFTYPDMGHMFHEYILPIFRNGWMGCRDAFHAVFLLISVLCNG